MEIRLHFVTGGQAGDGRDHIHLISVLIDLLRHFESAKPAGEKS